VLKKKNVKYNEISVVLLIKQIHDKIFENKKPIFNINDFGKDDI